LWSQPQPGRSSTTIARTETRGRRFLLYLALGMWIIVVSSLLSHALRSIFRSWHLQWPNVPFFITLFGVPCTLAAPSSSRISTGRESTQTRPSDTISTGDRTRHATDGHVADERPAPTP
jgi:hypothetical protein